MPGRTQVVSHDLEVVDLVSGPDAHTHANSLKAIPRQGNPPAAEGSGASFPLMKDGWARDEMLGHRNANEDVSLTQRASHDLNEWVAWSEADAIDKATVMGIFKADEQPGLHVQDGHQNLPLPTKHRYPLDGTDDLKTFLANSNLAADLENDAYSDASPLFDGGVERAADTMKAQCLNGVLAVFPDICVEYVSGLFEDGKGTHADQLVVHILDRAEKSGDYPKAKVEGRPLKRKREIDEDEEATRKYGSERSEPSTHVYSLTTRAALAAEFPFTPMAFVNATLEQSKGHLFPAYKVLEEAERTWNAEDPPYNKIKTACRNDAKFQYEKLMSLDNPSALEETKSALDELRAAQAVCRNAQKRRERERQAELEEEENARRAQEEGTMMDCGCCFSEYPLNRMVHCNSKEALHWFCRGCARRTAETEVGNSKYEICCMSMDGCKAGFPMDQRSQFLDESLTIALDRNEQEAVLRMAGIENLASCPFCPFAAEYPPVEENKLFQCQNPDCEKLTCRLRKLESHIPKTCKEHAKEAGLSVRRQIEEAMSAALIRRCNKCDTPFVKDEGCNKMTCTRNGCYNVQCYVCSKSCSYNHFDDTGRGGKRGNCPLFESADERHEREVSKAESEALARVRADHPQYDDEDLKITVSEDVQKDEEKRRKEKAAIPQNARNLAHPPHLQIQQPVGGLPAVQQRNNAGLMPRYVPGWVPPVVVPPKVEAAKNVANAVSKAAPHQGSAQIYGIQPGLRPLDMPNMLAPVGKGNAAPNPADVWWRREEAAIRRADKAQQQVESRAARIAAQREQATRELEVEALLEADELAALERDVLRAQEAYRTRGGWDRGLRPQRL